MPQIVGLSALCGRRRLMASSAAMIGTFGLASAAKSVPADNSVLNVVMSRDVDNLDPHSTGAGPSITVRELLYDSLVDWDAAGNAIPALATRWQISADHLTYRFHLRRGVTFQDGAPLDANAVKASFDRLLSPDRRSAASGQMDFIAAVTIIDEATIDLTTRGANPLTLQYLGTGLAAVVSPADIARYGSGIIEHPTGSGPFILSDWSRGDRLVLKRNRHYWGDPPGFERIAVRTAPDAEVRLIALIAGDVQLADLVDPTDYAAILANRRLRLVGGGGARFVCFNLATQHGPTADLRVRQAMNHAIDKQAIINALLGGRGRVANSPIGPGNVGYHPVGIYDYDPAKAKRLLQAAGYDRSQTLQAIYPVGRFAAKEVAEAVQAMLADVDVKVEYTGYSDYTQYNEAEKRLDRISMAYTSFYPTVMDATSALFIRYRSGQFLNYNINDPAVDALLDAGQASFDPIRRSEIDAMAQARIWNDLPFLALFYPDVNAAVAAGLGGIMYFPNERLSLKRARIAS